MKRTTITKMADGLTGAFIALVMMLAASTMYAVYDLGIRQLEEAVIQEMPLIQAAIIATTTTNNVIQSDLIATLTTENNIKLDTHATVTTEQAIFSDLSATITTFNAIYTNVIATMTTEKSIKADTHATVTTSNVIFTSVYATMTTENAMYADIHATLTTANNIIFDPADSYASMTTANSIKVDTQAEIPLGAQLLVDSHATMTTVSPLYPDAHATLTTANVIKSRTNSTVLVDRATLVNLIPADAVYADIHASMTTAASVDVDTALGSGSVAAINTTLATVTSIKNDTTTIIGQVPTLQSNVSATQVNANTIAAQTVVLALPITGGTTISSPGAYRVISPITDGQIIIDSDNVCLILNGQSVTSLTGDTIIINDGHTNIYIANGSVYGSSRTSPYACIKVGNAVGGCSNITIEHIALANAGYGIRVLDNNNFSILRDLRINGCLNGIYATLSSLLRIRECTMNGNPAGNDDSTGIYVSSSYVLFANGLVGPSIKDVLIRGYPKGIDIQNAQFPVIEQCTMADVDLENVTIADDIFGIRLFHCVESSIHECTVSDVTIRTPAVGGLAITATGILVDNSRRSTITRCTINDLLAYSSGSAICTGINVAGLSATAIVDKCLIDRIILGAGSASGRATGVDLSSSNGGNLIANSIVSNVSTSCFYGASGLDDLIRNIGISSPTNFSPAPANVTSGYAGSNVIYNYSLPT